MLHNVRIANKMLTLLIMVYMTKTNRYLIFIKLSDDIYFIGVSIDGLYTISLGTETPIFLPWYLNWKETYSKTLRQLKTVPTHSLDSTLTGVQAHTLKALRETRFKCCMCTVDQKLQMNVFEFVVHKWWKRFNDRIFWNRAEVKFLFIFSWVAMIMQHGRQQLAKITNTVSYLVTCQVRQLQRFWRESKIKDRYSKDWKLCSATLSLLYHA